MHVQPVAELQHQRVGRQRRRVVQRRQAPGPPLRQRLQPLQVQAGDRGELRPRRRPARRRAAARGRKRRPRASALHPALLWRLLSAALLEAACACAWAGGSTVRCWPPELGRAAGAAGLRRGRNAAGAFAAAPAALCPIILRPRAGMAVCQGGFLRRGARSLRGARRAARQRRVVGGAALACARVAGSTGWRAGGAAGRRQVQVDVQQAGGQAVQPLAGQAALGKLQGRPLRRGGPSNLRATSSRSCLGSTPPAQTGNRQSAEARHCKRRRRNKRLRLQCMRGRLYCQAGGQPVPHLFAGVQPGPRGVGAPAARAPECEKRAARA